MSGARIRTGVIGCGLIGKRRAAVAAAHSASTLEVVADAVPAVADAVVQPPTVQAWAEVVKECQTDGSIRSHSARFT